MVRIWSGACLFPTSDHEHGPGLSILQPGSGEICVGVVVALAVFHAASNICLAADARRRVRVLQETARILLRRLRQHGQADLVRHVLDAVAVHMVAASRATAIAVLSLMEVVQAVRVVFVGDAVWRHGRSRVQRGVLVDGVRPKASFLQRERVARLPGVCRTHLAVFEARHHLAWLVGFGACGERVFLLQGRPIRVAVI